MKRFQEIDINNQKKESKKRIFLPLSILIPYGIILGLITSALFAIGPIALNYLRELLVYNGYISEYSVILIFIVCIFLFIVILTIMLRMNERIRQRYSNNNSTDNISFYSAYDEDRAYLEKEITKLSNDLLSSQKRWEEVNHLLLSSLNKNSNTNNHISFDDFLYNFNINPNNLTIDKNLIFVLTSFSDDAINDYITIKNICYKLGFNATRGDEELIKGDVLSHTVEHIAKSRIVIANINGRNPNVFYELGIAHAMNKPTLLVSHIENRIPFDIQNKFVVIYADQEDLEQKLETRLIQILKD